MFYLSLALLLAENDCMPRSFYRQHVCEWKVAHYVRPQCQCPAEWVHVEVIIIISDLLTVIKLSVRDVQFLHLNFSKRQAQDLILIS